MVIIQTTYGKLSQRPTQLRTGYFYEQPVMLNFGRIDTLMLVRNVQIVVIIQTTYGKLSQRPTQLRTGYFYEQPVILNFGRIDTLMLVRNVDVTKNARCDADGTQ